MNYKALLLCYGAGGVRASSKCKNVWFASSVTVGSKKSHQSAKEVFVSVTSQPVQYAVVCTVRMAGTAQPPASSLLLRAGVAGRVNTHL